jgi:hypothetical protein
MRCFESVSRVIGGGGDRSIEELELERDSMLIELLAACAKGEKAGQTAAAGAEQRLQPNEIQ